MTPLVVLGVVAAGLLVAVVASSPATLRSRERATARRRAHVQRHPDEATSTDVVLDLLREGLSPVQARYVVERAADRGIGAPTMWRWIERYDAQALSLVVGAELGRRDILAHLGNATLPDLEDLRVLAALNGLVLGGPGLGGSVPGGSVPGGSAPVRRRDLAA